jgi:hypothetical protein
MFGLDASTGRGRDRNSRDWVDDLDRVRADSRDAHPETEFATRALDIGKDLYIDEARLLALWRGPEQIFLVARSASLDRWKQVLLLKDANSYLIGRCASRVVLTNRLQP